jgi:hypothetical protein
VVIGRRGDISPVEFRCAELDLPMHTIATYDHLIDRARLKLRKIPRI